MQVARRTAPAVVLFVFASCAPVTMSPMAIRMRPEDVKGVNGAFGLRTGPRLSATGTPSRTASGSLGAFAGDKATFNLEQWAPAYDLVVSKAITETTSLFIGGQGEFYYPVPLPAYGLYAGVSQYHRLGKFAVGPALTVRGATDLGLSVLGASGTIAGGELSCALTYASEELPVAIVPFFGAHAVWSTGTLIPTEYAGAAFAMQYKWKLTYFEVSAGFGRVFQAGKPSWNAPVVGLRVGH